MIDHESVDAEKVRAALAHATEPRYTVESVGQLSLGIEILKEGHVDGVLLDLVLPDCQGLATFDRVWEVAAGVPVLIMCMPGDESLGIHCVERGAQDYLLKTHLHSPSLLHALRNMIDRVAAAEALFCERDRAEVTLNSIGDAVLSTDAAGLLTYLNIRAEQMTGWTRAEAIGRPLIEVFHIIDGDTREPAPNPVARAVRDNTLVGLSSNCILIHRDGHEAFIEDSAAVIHDRQGRAAGAVIVFHDVTATRAMSLQMAH